MRDQEGTADVQTRRAERPRAAGGTTRWYAGAIAAALGYVALGKLGINLEVARGVITPVWAPTGIALFALITLGWRAWPSIALAALITNATEGAPPAVAAGISLGNTLEAVAGAWLFTRISGGNRRLSRARDVLALTVAGLLSAMVSAGGGTTVLWLSDELTAGLASGWLLWWLGDVMGALLIAPLLLVWTRPDPRPATPRVIEGVLLTVAVAGTAAVVFVGGRWQFPYVLFPLLLYAALRFGQRGATLAVFLVTAVAIAGAVDGAVPIEGVNAQQTVQLLQALLGVVGVATMVLGATVEERAAAEASMRDSLSLYEAVVESTADGLLVVDQSGRIVTYNRQFASMWRIPDDVLASGADDHALAAVVDQLADSDEFLSRVRELYASNEVELASELAFKDGRVFERHSRPYRLNDSHGRVWSFRDVTGRREAEATRQRFLSMASHELRTPLTVTLGFTETLLSEWDRMDDALRRDLVARTRQQSERLYALVEGLLATAVLDSGNLVVQPAKVIVAEVAQAAVDEVGQGVAIAGPGDLAARADPDHLRQVLVNFIGNAVKYGAPPVSVDVRAAGRWAEIRVRDAGLGVPSDVRGKLFERFVRAAAAVDAGIPGSGLGLAITRDLARAQGGDVWYEDVEPHGACFGVRVPIA